MDIYLVGGVSANLKPLWTRTMDIYLAGTYSRSYVIEKWYEALGKGMKEFIGREMPMDMYLAGGYGERKSRVPENIQHGIHLLESFYYADEFTEKMIPFFGKFLLDSGAFTMFSDKTKSKGIQWEEYVDRYADFIVRNDVKHFFELDIDKLVGYDRVIELRKRLETKANRPCIPVWHKFRGKDNYLRMCDEYKYVAIGGIVSKEIKPEEYSVFPKLIEIAHKKDAKIHGLGFTALKWLPKCHFDSVDSTAWTTGNRFGAVYEFYGTTMVKHDRGANQRMKNTRELAINNFNEWVKFQKWAEVHL